MSVYSSRLKSDNSHRSPLDALDADSFLESTNDLMFPKNELLSIDHWVTFRAFETTQLDRRSEGQRKTISYISLPMPGNLHTAYNIQYHDSDLQAFGQIIVDAFGSGQTADAARQTMATVGTGALSGAIVGGITSGDISQSAMYGALGAGVVDASINPNTGSGQALLAQGVGNAGSVGQGILANSGGLARNPHKVMLFDQVGFRTHQFAYQFTPKSYAEADELRKIIRLFKLHASPSFNANLTLRAGEATNGLLQNADVNVSAGKHFFKYPEYFEIDYHHPKFLYQIGPSVLESIGIDYHPAGQPSYNRAGDAEPTPTQINITLSFKETEIVTKENILSENR